MAVTDERRGQWRSALAGPSPNTIASAMYDIGEARERQLAAGVLAAAVRVDHPRVTQEAVWAIGKLGYTPGTEYVIRATYSRSYSVRKGAFWALGELGTSEAEARLNDVDGLEGGELAQIIGGALKKIRGDTVRASRAQVMRRPKRPNSSDPQAQAIIGQLESDGLSGDETVALRAQLLARDEGLFREYMDYVREKEKVSKTLRSGRVY